jgi:hypothetical protein
MRRVKRWVAATVLSGSLATGAGVGVPAMMAAPAGAQQVGLVNVEIDISNVLNENNVTVAVPVNAAANICGVSVNVINVALGPQGPGFFECTSQAGQDVRITQRQ